MCVRPFYHCKRKSVGTVILTSTPYKDQHSDERQYKEELKEKGGAE